jgi:hypothetical protein
MNVKTKSSKYIQIEINTKLPSDLEDKLKKTPQSLIEINSKYISQQELADKIGKDKKTLQNGHYFARKSNFLGKVYYLREYVDYLIPKLWENKNNYNDNRDKIGLS